MRHAQRPRTGAPRRYVVRASSCVSRGVEGGDAALYGAAARDASGVGPASSRLTPAEGESNQTAAAVGAAPRRSQGNNPLQDFVNGNNHGQLQRFTEQWVWNSGVWTVSEGSDAAVLEALTECNWSRCFSASRTATLTSQSATQNFTFTSTGCGYVRFVRNSALPEDSGKGGGARRPPHGHRDPPLAPT